MRRLVLVLLVACSNDDEIRDKQAECDGIAADIRAKATSYGIPPQGACNNPSPTIQQNLASACAALTRCNADLEKLRD